MEVYIHHSCKRGWRYIYTIHGKEVGGIYTLFMEKRNGKGHLIRFEKHKQVRIEREKKNEGVSYI